MSVQSPRPDVQAAVTALKGAHFAVKASLKRLPEVLSPDETVQALAVAQHDSVMGVLALTDRRVLFSAQGWGGQRHVTYRLGEVTDARWSETWAGGSLTVQTAGWSHEFSGMDKRDGQTFSDRLRHWRDWHAQQAGQPSAGPFVPTTPPQPYVPHQATALAGPLPQQAPAPTGSVTGSGSSSGSGGIFGRRRKQAEAEAARLAEDLAAAATDAAAVRAENQRLVAELTALAGADAARLVQEAERLRRTHDERLAEVRGIDALLDTKIEAAARRAESELQGVRQRHHELEIQARDAERRLAAAQGGLVVTDELALLQEAGVYEYRHPLADAVAYKAELDRIKDRYKALIKNGRAVVGVTEWTVNGSAAEGRRMVRDFSKLMLRAYNAEADAAVRGMKPHRLSSLVDRLDKSRETIARLGKTMQIRVTDEYHRMRVRELELTADHLAKQEYEKEQRREQRAQQREEERLEREIARERERLDKERNRLVLALNRARAAGQSDPAQIAELERKLSELDAEQEVINQREANRRAGYVYVISNIGAFGEAMVKIGLTRRLDPMDRVNELGDASVPFRFDVHALIYSDDAVSLERALHQDFESRRVNRVNARREFFHATPAEVRDALARHAGQHLLEFHEEPDAPEWRASRGSA